MICTRDRPEDLARCVRSLEAQTHPAQRVLVIDSGSSAPTAVEGAEVFASQPGLTKQRNVGIDLCRGDLVAFFDDDAEPSPGYLEAVVNWFSERPGCVGVSGNIVNDPVRSSASRLYRRLFALAQADGKRLPSGEGSYLRHPTVPTRVEVLSGANMTFRRDLIAELRFDEWFSGYSLFEDVEISLRASRRGQLWSLPEAAIVHHQTAVARTSDRDFVRHVLVGGAHIYGKHRQEFGLRRTAFARRLVGRSLGYMGLALRRRSLEPARGVLDAARELKSMRATTNA